MHALRPKIYLIIVKIIHLFKERNKKVVIIYWNPLQTSSISKTAHS